MNTKFVNIGLLVLRIGIGIAFIIHGAPKMFGGAEKWQFIGQSMSNLGIDFLPKFWGFMASFAEFGGGICLTFGFLSRPVCFLLFLTMIVALISHISAGDSFRAYSHALEAAVVFVSLFITGAGQYSIDNRIFQ